MVSYASEEDYIRLCKDKVKNVVGQITRRRSDGFVGWYASVLWTGIRPVSLVDREFVTDSTHSSGIQSLWAIVLHHFLHIV